MPDYDFLLNRCQYVNKISAALIDEFLVYYAARQDKLDREFDTRFSRFRDLEKEMPSNWKGLVKAQYIGHRIFRERGLVHKYLHSAAVKTRSSEEQEFLSFAAVKPWRFSFSEIRNTPAPDFFEMEDVFTGEAFLLYSPTVTRTLSEHPVMLWFNLIGHNGSCWQTFGQVSAFQSFDADDIFFYATELNPAIESEDDLLKEGDDNPVRFMVLAWGSYYPLVIHQGHEIVQVAGEGNAALFNVQELRKDFRVEYAERVFKLSHEVWSEPPYYAEAYCDETSDKIFLYALTEKGYEELWAILKVHGLNVPEGPDIRLHLSMAHVIKKVLKKKMGINPYGPLFETSTSPEAEAQMSKLNRFLSLAMPYINSGGQPDIAALASEAGVDAASANEIYQKAVGRISKLRK